MSPSRFPLPGLPLSFMGLALLSLVLPACGPQADDDDDDDGDGGAGGGWDLGTDIGDGGSGGDGGGSGDGGGHR